MAIYISTITVTILCMDADHVCVADRTCLNVGALLELSHFRFGKYYNFFNNILDHAFSDIETGTTILPGYTLDLIPKDTKVFTAPLLLC